MCRVDPLIELSYEQLSKAKRIILIGGGKGGVGKSVISAGIAFSLSKNYKVGVLDLDLQGPAIPVLFTHKLKERLRGDKEGLKPIILGNLSVMSLGFIVEERPLPLSGRDRADAVLEFLAHIHWNPLDYLLVDLPPGMGDEVLVPLRIIKKLKHGFIVVTRSSRLALPVTKRFIEFLRKEQVKILGVIENMYEPYLASKYEERVRELLNRYEVELLGKVPYDPYLESLLLNERNILESEKLARAFREISPKVVKLLN